MQIQQNNQRTQQCPHPDFNSCPNKAGCASTKYLPISFIASLSVFEPKVDVQTQLDAVHSTGHLKGGIYNQHFNPLISQRNPNLEGPQTICCSRKWHQSVCGCNVFELRKHACQSQDETKQKITLYSICFNSLDEISQQKNCCETKCDSIIKLVS